MPHLVLSFLSGRHEGAEFPLHPGKEIVIGRDTACDLPLHDDMASRRHAWIENRDGEVWLHDGGSANGTFVNGQRIDQHRLAIGDRILIGSSIMRVAGAAGTDTTEEEGRRRMALAANLQQTHTLRPFMGTIEDIPLPDLLQLLATGRKTGVLIIHRASGVVGRIHLRDGAIVHATISDGPEMRARKALFRILDWTSGGFVVAPPEPATEDGSLSSSPLQGLLLQAMQELDEVPRMRRALPTLVSRESREVPPETEVDRDVALLLDAEDEPVDIQRILDASPHTDGQTAASLMRLLDIPTPAEE